MCVCVCEHLCNCIHVDTFVCVCVRKSQRIKRLFCEARSINPWTTLCFIEGFWIFFLCAGCSLYSALYKRSATISTANKLNKSQKIYCSIERHSPKMLLRVCFFLLCHGVVSHLSECDLLIYSFLPWSKHFVNTATPIQEHINTQGRSTGLAGQPEQNPNK